MRKKNTIRLNESTLNRIIKESVKKTVNEVSQTGYNAIKSAAKRAEKNRYSGMDFFGDTLSEVNERIGMIQKLILDLIYNIGKLGRNPRISKDYIDSAQGTLQKLFDDFKEDGPIADAIINQKVNKWTQDLSANALNYDKPQKGINPYEINYDEEI